MTQFYLVDNHYFTMFDENFENWLSETLQNGSILILVDNHYLTMVDGNFEFFTTS